MRLISRVIPDEQLAEQGMQLARELAAGPTHALAETRKLLLDSYGADFRLHLGAEAASIALAGAHAEGREGISAFIQKRSAQFL